jgi:hypothetical protein
MTATFVRIRFHLPRDRRLNAEAKTFAVSHAELPTDFEIVALEADTISRSSNLVVRSSPLGTAEGAAALGQRAELALMIAAAKTRLGIDLGTTGPMSGFFPAGLEVVRNMNQLAPETAVVNDKLGVTLVDASRKTVFAGLGPFRRLSVLLLNDSRKHSSPGMD